jgi:hypothetical protein
MSNISPKQSAIFAALEPFQDTLFQSIYSNIWAIMGDMLIEEGLTIRQLSCRSRLQFALMGKVFGMGSSRTQRSKPGKYIRH